MGLCPALQAAPVRSEESRCARRTSHGEIPELPGVTEASSTSSLPPLDNLQIQLHDGQKMEAAVGCRCGRLHLCSF